MLHPKGLLSPPPSQGKDPGNWDLHCWVVANVSVVLRRSRRVIRNALRDKNHCLPVHLCLLLFSFDSLSSSQDKFSVQREMQPGHRILLTLVINKKKNKKQTLRNEMLFFCGKTYILVTCLKGKWLGTITWVQFIFWQSRYKTTSEME